MKQHTVTFEPMHVVVTVEQGTSLLRAQILAGLNVDAPCGGNGTCGKCRVLVDGQQVLACKTLVDRDMTVWYTPQNDSQILKGGISAQLQPDGTCEHVFAVDLGTTTIVLYLLSGTTGEVLAKSSCLNPQRRFGADVISRVQYALAGNARQLQAVVWDAITALLQTAAEQAGVSLQEIGGGCIVGNTAMQHLLLNLDTKPLVTPPYMPSVSEALVVEASEHLPIRGSLRILPNIAGFVGGDTVACMKAVDFDGLEEITLLVDIGTNGEMVLGNKERAVACSTAAGPAFEGAKISCGMRGETGAVDHVFLKDGQVSYHVIGDVPAKGLCGSGILDLIAVLLELGVIDGSGYMRGKSYRLGDSDVVLTQKDVREVQLAKAAIFAGIHLLAEHRGISVNEIQQVLLAGAFGNYMDPVSACRIGMIPECLQDRIRLVGNAAGEGAKACALSEAEFLHTSQIAWQTEFLELATRPNFQDCYVDALAFGEDE